MKEQQLENIGRKVQTNRKYSQFKLSTKDYNTMKCLYFFDWKTLYVKFNLIDENNKQEQQIFELHTFMANDSSRNNYEGKTSPNNIIQIFGQLFTAKSLNLDQLIFQHKIKIKCKKNNIITFKVYNPDDHQIIRKWTALSQSFELIQRQNQLIDKLITKIKQQTCPVCLSQNCNIMTQCKHNYHEQCFKQWFKKSEQCALCRKKCNHQIRKIQKTTFHLLSGLQMKYETVKIYSWTQLQNFYNVLRYDQ